MDDDVFGGKKANVDPDDMAAYLSLALSSDSETIKEALVHEAETPSKKF